MAAETIDDIFAPVDIPVEMAGFMPAAPALVGVGWIKETYNIPVSTIYAAIYDGALPTVEVPGARGAVSYVIRPESAFKLWGPRLMARALQGDKKPKKTSA